VRRLRVAIGAVAGVTGGPATYAVELVRALATLESAFDSRLDLTVLTDRADLFGGLPGVEVVELPLGSAWSQPWWDNVAVPRALRRLGADVYHGTKNALPLVGGGDVPRTVVTIHDLAVYAEPETFSWAQRLQLRVHLRHAGRSADRVICVSQHAAGDVVERLGVPRERITVVPHGIGAAFRPLAGGAARTVVRQEYGVGPAGFLLAYVGTAQPRKRIEVAVAAASRLVDEGLPVTLAIAGRRRPGYAPDFLERPPPFVRVVGEVPSEQLVALLGAADVMVSPSTYEGFGLTFAEAMACGCPVVGVAVTSVPEVVGEGGILVERSDPELVADAIGSLLRDPALRARTVAAARARAAALSWEEAARRTAEVYRAAAAG